MKRRNNSVYVLSLIALMIAIQCIFGFTPLGTIQTPALTITLMGIPVAIMACVFGPVMGTISGAVWGAISLIQAFTGMDAMGTLLLSATDISPARKILGLVCMCFIARMLAGFLAGLFFDLVRKKDKKGYVSSLVASLSVSFFNTLFFMTLFCLFFFTAKAVQDNYVSYYVSQGWNAANPFIFVIAVIGINFIVELSVNGIVGSLASYGLIQASEKMGLSNPFPRFFQRTNASKTKNG